MVFVEHGMWDRVLYFVQMVIDAQTNRFKLSLNAHNYGVLAHLGTCSQDLTDKNLAVLPMYAALQPKKFKDD